MRSGSKWPMIGPRPCARAYVDPVFTSQNYDKHKHMKNELVRFSCAYAYVDPVFTCLLSDHQVDWYPGGNEVYFWNTKDRAKNLSRPCFGKLFCLKIYFPFGLCCTSTVYARPILEYLFLTKIMLHGGLLWLQLKEPTSVKGPFLTLNAKKNTVIQYFTRVFPCLTISPYLRRSFGVITHGHYNLLLFLSTLNTFRVLRKWQKFFKKLFSFAYIHHHLSCSNMK